ncbi:MAG: hypothetical protein PGN27_09690 [Mycolicibacterium neoaurum]|uniref:hypothetical protein n=1 Tax=Mycolicibacterium neoaurum TaxID=1795 RepID=UPI002FFC2AF6
MATDADWTIRPRLGLGRLEFGMSPVQVDALTSTYGARTGRGADRVTDDMLRETLAMFGDAMTDDEKRAFIAEYTGGGPSSDSVTETRGNVVLRYEADRLCEIMHSRRPLFLDGRDLFALSGLDALRLLQRLNAGPGRYADTEAAFDELAISVDGFSVHDPTAGVLALDDGDERFRQRTVTLRDLPYQQDAHRYTVYSLPPATDR